MTEAAATLYTIPAGENFLQSLADNLRDFTKDNFQKALVLLPTRRGCTALCDIFLRSSSGGDMAMLLPRIRQLSVAEEDELLITGDTALAESVFALPPAISPMRRRFLLMQQILAQKEPDMTEAQAFQLAGDLGRLLDQALIENCDFQNLVQLVEGVDLAEHWEKIVRFLSIVTKFWPLILAERGVIDAVDRRQRLLRLQIRHWQEKPPAYPVIAAGSTGSHPVTSDFLKAISQLPKGAVILPGLDVALDEPRWQAITPEHPQFLLKKLLGHLGAERGDVKLWGEDKSQGKIRSDFISEVLCPAEKTDSWRHLSISMAGQKPWQGMEAIVAEHEQQEALIAALILRQTVETPDKTAALVTPDRVLAARVAGILQRWDIAVDDSAGRPLFETSLASYFMLMLALARADLLPSQWMAFLKHPKTTLRLGRGECLRLGREMEKDFFRQNICGQGIATWKKLIGADKPYRHLLDLVDGALSGLPQANEKKDFGYWIDTHLALADAFTDSPLWQGSEGEAMAGYFDSLRAAAPDFCCRSDDYAGIFSEGLRQEIIRARYGQHPRLHILGLIEARMLSFDTVVLAGLNEGTWPEIAAQDPWMSSAMRVKFGLPHPDQHIGQTAHDFEQLAAQPKVFLLRCARQRGAPTIPARWLLRLDTVLHMLGQKNALKPLLPWQEWARRMDRPETITPREAPAVSVLVSQLPPRLSASDIDMWVGDPYAFYAKRVLGLAALGGLDSEMGARERGTVVHAVLDKLAKTYANIWPVEAKEKFLELLVDGYAAQGCDAESLRFMLPRLQVVAEKFWKHEAERRQKSAVFYTEIKGELTLPIGAYHPVLHARADRIDVLADGTLVIADYKTGQAPTGKKVAAALKPQLLVEAMIAAQRGFGSILSNKTSELNYIKLGDGAALVEETAMTTEKLDAALSLEGLCSFIAAYLEEGAVFHAAPRPRLLAPHVDYARLARVAEWSKGEIQQEDAET